jgi:hypothetical protein
LSTIPDKVYDKGPWTVQLGGSGQVLLQSDDFTHDVTLTIHGDFADLDQRKAYGQELADTLTNGCARRYAALEVADEKGIRAMLDRAVAGPHAEVLQQAADEIARLRCELAGLNAALEQLQAGQYLRNKGKQASEASPFALALQAALAARTSS